MSGNDTDLSNSVSPDWLYTEWRDASEDPILGHNSAVIGLSRAGEPGLSTATRAALAAIVKGADAKESLRYLGSLLDVAIATSSSSVWLVRGGASRTRLFVDRRRANRIRLTDRVQPNGARLRSDFLIFALAHATLAPFERRSTAATVFDGIECLPPSMFARVTPGSELRPEQLNHDTGRLESATRSTAIEAVRAALDQSVSSALIAAGNRSIVFEISGGLDSSVVAARALASLRSRRDTRSLSALSIRYPYYEFRRESIFANAVSEKQGLRLALVAGDGCLPFDGWEDIPLKPYGDEPGLQQVGRMQYLAAFSSGGSRRHLLFHGLGGDVVFGLGPTQQLIVRKPPARPVWMGRSAWRAFLNEWEVVHNHFPDTLDGYRSQFFSGANIDDCWADMYVAPHFGSVRAGGFTDPRLLNAVSRLWQLGPLSGTKRYKWIIREAFYDDLPEVVREREHKVPYDGIYVRGYRRHSIALHALVDRHRRLLEDSGISGKRVEASIDRIAHGNLDNDLLLSMLLCCLEWVELAGAVTP